MTLKTRNAWIPLSDAPAGTELASVDGQSNVVTGISRGGLEKFYCVVFSDGRSVDAAAHHLWKVHFVHEYKDGFGSGIHNGWHVFTTDAIRTFCLNGNHRNGHRRVFLPLVNGDFGSSDPLPIDPWLLGALIGDGGLTEGSPTITTADSELVARVHEKISSFGIAVKAITCGGAHRYGYRLSGDHKGPGQNRLSNALRDVGLFGLDSSEKFIPGAYLNASRERRWQLLRGLLDTDGTAGWSDEASFMTTSYRLAVDVQHLIRSLGGLSQIFGPKRKWCLYKGEKRLGRPAFYVSARLPEREKAFSLSRKIVSERQNLPRLSFESIEYVGEREKHCIALSHPSQLFIADDYTVTHC